jgi:excisionase family DNA binding protein
MQIVVPAKRLYSPAETGEQLGVSTRTVWNLIRSGVIESVKVGQLRKVPAEAIDGYIAQLRRGGGGAA